MSSATSTTCTGVVVRTSVKATCVSCGDISLTTDDVVVRLLVGWETLQDGHQYRFRCPRCNEINVRQTSLYIVNLLLTAGVHSEIWDHPLEVLERPDDDMPPLNLDDVIDLHFDLEDEEAWINRMKGD